MEWRPAAAVRPGLDRYGRLRRNQVRTPGAAASSLFISGGISTQVQPYSNFGQVEYTSPIGFGNYNGLQGSLTRQMTNGLSLRAAYTYSRSLDNTPQELESNSGDPPDGRNYGAWYGTSDFDVTHRISASYVYELPF